MSRRWLGDAGWMMLAGLCLIRLSGSGGDGRCLGGAGYGCDACFRVDCRQRGGVRDGGWMSVADHGWLTGCQSVGLRAASALPEVTGAHVIVHVNMNRSRYLPLGGYGGRPEVAATGRPPGGSLLSVAALGVGPPCGDVDRHFCWRGFNLSQWNQQVHAMLRFEAPIGTSMGWNCCCCCCWAGIA